MNVEFRVETVTESPVQVGDLVYDGYRVELTSPSSGNVATLFTTLQVFTLGDFVNASFEVATPLLQEQDVANTNPLSNITNSV